MTFTLSTRRNLLLRALAVGLASTTGGLAPERARARDKSSKLTVGYGSLGANRHPHAISNLPDTDIANLICDPLLTLTAQSAIEPVLATHYERVGDARWRFRLRPGVTFHDGRPLTAHDVKTSLENYLRPGIPNRYLYESWLDQVLVIDNLTAEVVAKKPYRVALANMAYLSHVIPRSATNSQAVTQRPIGTGPYRFVEFVPNDRVVLESNPTYWGSRKAVFGSITLRQIAENSTRLAALETGEVDAATDIPVDDVPRLRRAGLQVFSVASNRVMFIRFNIAADGPWRDVRVRRALNHAVDRTALRQALLGGLGADAQAPLPLGVQYAARSLPPYRFDPRLARELMAAAGYARGFSATLVTPSGRYLKDREVAEAVAGQLESIGISLRIVPLEWATYLQQVRTEKDSTGRQYGLGLMAWGNILADPDFGLAPFDARNPWNLGGYSNAELQGLIDRGRETFDDAKLGQIYARAQEIVWADAPWIFLAELPVTVALSARLKGYVPRPDEQIRWHSVSVQ